ncbi:MAG: hypothetical protein ABJZ55_21985 [Fuerstiella sp.]
MSLQKQLLSNKRLWVRGLTLIVIIGVALLKPKFDEYMADRQSGDNSVAQTDSNSRNSNSRSTSANASSDADLSLDDLLASVREDSNDDSDGDNFKSDKTVAASQQTTTKQTKKDSTPSTSSTKSNPKGTTSSSKTKDSQSSTAGNTKLNPNGSNASGSKTTKKPADKPRLGKLTLVRGTRDEFRSTAGLMYVPGSADGHRLKHVLKHAKDNPSKPVHGVFDGDRDQILEWIDKAYLMGKNGDKNARKESQRDRTVYTANLNQRVGYVGGQKGKRNNNKECRFLRLVIENGTEVVTAYPSDRM